MARPGRQLVLVPTDVAWAYTAAAGWHPLTVPPAWWLEERDAGQEPPRAALRLVPDLPVARTSCRPGSGPCRRRHEHVSQRRGTVAS